MPTADLSITMDDGTTTVAPGAATSYTIIASNSGPTDVTGALVLWLPSSSTAADTWTEVTTIDGVTIGSPTIGSGPIIQTVDLPVGGAVTFTLIVLVDPSAPGGSTMVQSASVSTPLGTTDTNFADNSARDIDALTLRPTWRSP